MSIKGILGTAATAIGSAVGGPVGGAIGSSIAGAVLGNDAAKSAGNLASNATSTNNALQERIYNETSARQEPLYQNGLAAQNKLAQLITGGGLNTQFQFDANDLYNDSSYQFRLNQGTRALQNSAAARGGLDSGAALKALTRYGQDYASTEYGNAYNRAQGTFNQNLQNTLNPLQSLAGQAQTSASALGSAGQNYANQTGANNTGLANSLGASTIAQSNALSGGLTNASSAYSSNNLLQQLLGQGASPAWQKVASANSYGYGSGGYTGGMSIDGP